MDWFAEHLDKPRRFKRSHKKDAAEKAISWYKDNATVHIGKMNTIAEILREHGVTVEILRTEKPGYIVYEDEFQVMAEPFKETQT